MENFDFTSEYFFEISRRCKYNERMAENYEKMADNQYDKIFPLDERDVDLHVRRYSPDYLRMETYVNRAKSIRNCMRYGWLSDYYRLQRVKVVQGVNRCRDRFCYNCQSLDALQRFHEYAPFIDSFSDRFDIYHVVLSQPNVPGFILSQTMDLMQQSFSKLIGYLSGKKKLRDIPLKEMYGFEGAVRAFEVSQNDEDTYYHPHLHVLLVLKKGLSMEPKHKTMFSKDYTGRREERLFSDFEVFLQRIWYLLMNRIKVTKKNLEALPKVGKRSYPDGFSCYCENAHGHYHEVFKYATKGSFKNQSILNDYDCFETLYRALYKRRVYQTYGCLYDCGGEEVDMNVLHEDNFNPADLADMCFNEIIECLGKVEQPVRVVEDLTDILRAKVAEEERSVKYLSAQSIRHLFDESPPEQRAELKTKLIAYFWQGV